MGVAPRIGVFGGSFDPPHEGHQSLVDVALARLLLDELWIIPVGQAVHRNLTASVTAQQRLQWVKDMFGNTDKVRVLDWEVIAPSPVPSCDTLGRIRRDFPSITPIFLLGMDAWQKMEGWVGYPIHHKLCNVAVFLRAGITPCHIEGWKILTLAGWQTRQWQGTGHAVFLDDTLPDLSATSIRDQLSRGCVPSSIKKQANWALLQQCYQTEE